MKNKNEFDFLLLMVQVLISCASFDSSSQGGKVDESLSRPAIVSEKPEQKVPEKEQFNVFNYDYERTGDSIERPLFSLKGGDHLELQNAVFDFLLFTIGELKFG